MVAYDVMSNFLLDAEGASAYIRLDLWHSVQLQSW